MPAEGLNFGAKKPEINVPEQMEPMQPMALKFGRVETPQRMPQYVPTLETMKKPFLDETYRNMFDPNAAAKRAKLLKQRTPMPMVPPSYNDMPAFGMPEQMGSPRLY